MVKTSGFFYKISKKKRSQSDLYIKLGGVHLNKKNKNHNSLQKFQEWIGQGQQLFANLRFLVLVEFSWPEKFSLESLDTLKTLWFITCDLVHFGKSELGLLPKKLENLCFWDCDFSKELNLAKLNHLRKLEIYINTRPWLWEDKIIVKQNTISRLSDLEELSLPTEFYIGEECAEDGPLPILDEVCKLSRLTSLNICSRESKSGKLATIFSNLREFHLFVGKRQDFWSRGVSWRTKSITLSNHDLIEHYKPLFEKAEEVILCGTNFTGRSIDIRDTKEFINLKYMKIQDCQFIEYLARMSPGNKIGGSLPPSLPFSQLKIPLLQLCCKMS